MPNRIADTYRINSMHTERLGGTTKIVVSLEGGNRMSFVFTPDEKEEARRQYNALYEMMNERKPVTTVIEF